MLLSKGSSRKTSSIGAKSGLSRLRGHHWQFRLPPGIESANHIDDVLETRALQQAAGNHATVSALAVNRHGRIVIHLRRRDSEVVERPPGRVRNVRDIPLRLATDVKHLQFVGLQPCIELVYGDLRNSRPGKSRLLPGGNATLQIPAKRFDTNARQPEPGLFQL